MADLSYVPFEEFERVRNLDVDPVTRTSLFAALCRVNTLYMIKYAGSGHIGTSFSCIDIVSWLFLNEMRNPGAVDGEGPQDIYFSSKGHDAPGLYSILIGQGLMDFSMIHRLRNLGGLPGHPDVHVPYMHVNSGSLGMGISKAKGMITANRLQGVDQHIYVLTGDGELQEGQLWESLGSAVRSDMGELTVIVDHNKVQSDLLVSDTSDLGDLEAKFSAFGWRVARCDGNDLNSLADALAGVKDAPDQPKIIIADTLKGAGVSFMEHTAMKPEDERYMFHSGAPSDDDYASASTELLEKANALLTEVGTGELNTAHGESQTAPAPQSPQRLVDAYSSALLDQAAKNPKLVALDADLMLDSGLIPFKKEFPDRYFQCGIAEQDMVSQAGGMALNGLIPVVHSFACFLSTRPNEQIYTNATEGTKIIYMSGLAGLIPGGTGHSHQSVRDISAVAAVPGMLLIQPSTDVEVVMAVDFCVNQHDQSSYLRLTPLPIETPYQLPDGYQLELGKGVALTDGDDAVMFAYGPVMLSQAVQASINLKNQEIGLKVVNLPWLNTIDADWLAETVGSHDAVFTLDDHYLIGGQGDMILSQLSQLALESHPKARKLGVDRIPECGSNDDVLHAHGLDAEGIAATVTSALGK